jgi:hypothetical protein
LEEIIELFVLCFTQVNTIVSRDTTDTLLEKALNEFGRNEAFLATRKYVLVTKDSSRVEAMCLPELLDLEGVPYPRKLRLYIMEEGKKSIFLSVYCQYSFICF